ncbi:MAG: hypothetical protein B7Z37_16045 [Verrucomicrobia bacterium 12-59-8]|nr:MAG: hypothetical protein B7Z37_16045 [Verrucomicrobia bacterium 12-59-8]
MISWHIHPAAEDELEAALEHYLGIDPELAHSFDEHYKRCRGDICKEPLLFNIRRSNTRRINLTPRFGEYYIAYMIWQEKLVILAIAHAKRRPYYWRKRIEEAREMF